MEIFTKMLLVFCTICLVASGAVVHAQTVQGTVISTEDNSPLPGANVIVKSTGEGSTTDLDGNYKVNAAGDDVLLISFIGMKTQQVPVSGRSIINVALKLDVAQLSEVVVVGYGTQKRADISSSISTLDENAIENVPAAYSFDGAIQGKAAGVNISTSSATPGAAVNVNIRGVTSIGASSQPLYVIDGIPLVSRNNSALNSNIQPVNPLADINPNDIESISVLKDASAAAIYGSRGANGVIIITTKRGTTGGTKFNLGYYTGISEISNTPDLMSSSEWINFYNTAAEFDGLGENYWNSQLGDPNDPNLPHYNAYDYIFRTGITHNADLSMQGGGEKTQYYLSGNYYNQEGIQIGQGFERINGRLNLDHSVNDKMSVGTNLTLSRTNHQRTINENDEYGVVINAQAWDPTAPVVEDDGSYADPFDYYGWWALDNPLFIAEQYINNSNTNRVLASAFATYDIIKGLTFKTSWSVDFNSLIDEGFVPAGSKQSDVGVGIYATADELAWLSENTLTYNSVIGDGHNISILGGYTVQESNSDFATTEGNGFPNNNFFKLATAATTSGTSSSTSFGFQSFLARANYNFKDRYLLNFTIRADQSSRFGPDNRLGVFPSGSIGWNISNEAFMEPIRNTVSNLKLRASYGSTGNAEIGNFSWRALYSLSAGYNGEGGTAPGNIGNDALGWEVTDQLDIGIDIGLINNRFNITADYFQKITTDLLLDADIPGTTGFGTQTTNFGEIQNEGFEVALNTLNIETDDFQWTSNFNFTQVENKVIDVINNGQTPSRNFVILEGKPLSQLFLIEFLGVDPFTGDAVFEDLNGDGIITQDDRQPVGSGIPTYFGGFTNTFSYKGVSLEVFLQYSGGNKIFNQSRFAYENYGALRSGIPYGNQSKNSLDYWREPGDITNIPRPSLASEDDTDDLQFQRFSTQYLENGDFIRLKNVRLAYQLPSALISKLKLSSATVYAQGRNLLTWTDYIGFDPEVSTNTSSQGGLNAQQGEDFGTLGQARTYTLGINLGF